MSAASLAIYNDQRSRGVNIAPSNASPKVVITHKVHPSPFTSKISSGGTPSFVRGVLLSVALHLTLILSAVILNLSGNEDKIGTPQEEVLNVSIIPLSELDTLLPKGDTSSKPDAQKQEPVATNEAKFAKSERSEITNEVPIKIPKPVKKLSVTQEKPSVPGASNSSKSNAQSATSLSFGVSSGDEITISQARINYQDMIATLIARAKRYPERALKRGMTGDGSVRIEITADGTIADFKIIQSTDAPILDEELRAMVDRAAPFPAFPRDLNRSVLAVVIPVSFRIQG